MPCNNGGGITGCDSARSQYDEALIAQLRAEVSNLTGFLCATLHTLLGDNDDDWLCNKLLHADQYHKCGDIYSWYIDHCDFDKQRVEKMIDEMSEREQGLMLNQLKDRFK